MNKLTDKDFTQKGMRLEGAYENDRNAQSADVFKAIIRTVYGVKDVIIGHHLVYAKEEIHDDGFSYEIVEEIPSADTLIFDHEVAKILWPDCWQDNLVKLALTPIANRDDVLASLLHNPLENNSGKEV